MVADPIRDVLGGSELETEIFPASDPLFVRKKYIKFPKMTYPQPRHTTRKKKIDKPGNYEPVRVS